MIKRYSAVIVLFTTLFAGNVIAAEPAIQVSGEGRVAVVPDAYTMTFVLEERGELVAKLNGQLQSDMSAILTFLLKNGIEEKNVQSMQINLNPYYESTPQGRQQNGFILSREVRITDTNIDNYDSIIDGALSRGVDRVQDFRFIASEQQNAYQKALINAVKDARLRASLLAEELGVSLGNVLSVSESGQGYPMPVMRMEMAKADSFSTAMPGEQQISARVNVTFAINN
ncbi:SIMPL domain-containing protein [Aestuariibacter sp. A3R04]|uniref:SIMPL domain-containing protein n=1 Tax=Aestuariibacter sp. A3R04 TaxID=2841571 RepID=UPI001C0872C4|nr:SIMPL domain-containing protein [Aestuariibacter sp. A3R04]MBU3022914.1 SIMPL domain-containing protein [Aestuariibacter sp. A3R04]